MNATNVSSSDGRPLPEIDEDTGYYWDAAREERLVLQRCGTCNVLQTYPRKMCMSCWSRDLHWLDAEGTGVVYSFSVVHRPPPGFEADAPYVLAIIELDEGVKMMSNVIGCDASEVFIGMPVAVVFDRVSTDVVLAKFSPVA